jgi:Tol biopolymer transport system component
MKTFNVQFLKWLTLLSLLLLFGGRLFAQIVDYYDIYVYDLKTGTTGQVSSIPNAGEYNCSWAPNSMKIVSESVENGTWMQNIYVTDIGTGISTLLTGGEGGNDATWSPNGQNISFDMYWYYIYSIPATGGEPTMLREAAYGADWSPNSQYIVFTDWNSGCITTMNLKDKSETTVTCWGENPVWSPNGQYIAYESWTQAPEGWFYRNGIGIIKVDEFGKPLGDPINLTTSGNQPSWSNNSKTIFYSDLTVIDAENTDAGDIYSISIEGGTPQRICGRVDTQFGDYDPCVSNNGQYIAFSSATNPPKSRLALTPGNDPLKNNLKVSVLGNPSKSDFRLNFQSKSSEILSIRIMDATGKTILNQSGIEPNSMLSVGNDFGKGVYFAEIRQGMQRKVIKLLKQ